MTRCLHNVVQQFFALILDIEELDGRNVFPTLVVCESQQYQEILTSVSGVIHIFQGRPNRLSALQPLLSVVISLEHDFLTMNHEDVLFVCCATTSGVILLGSLDSREVAAPGVRV